MKINEQIVLVTGGARGLGQAISRAVAREGAGVVINYYKSGEAAASLAKELGSSAIAIPADITDAAQVGRLFEKAAQQFGKPITSVVNNALVDFRFNGDARKKLDQIGWAEFEQQLKGAIGGALNTIQAAALA